MSLSAKYCPTISPEIGKIEHDLVKYKISSLPYNYEFNPMQIIFLSSIRSQGFSVRGIFLKYLFEVLGLGSITTACLLEGFT